MSEVPEKCPLIDTCKEDILQEEYDFCCATNSWVYCEAAKEAVKKYLKKPREWKQKELGK